MNRPPSLLPGLQPSLLPGRPPGLLTAGGVALGLLLARFGPLPADDPLAGTLAILPAALAALAELAALGRGRIAADTVEGGRPATGRSIATSRPIAVDRPIATGRSIAVGEAAILALLVLLTVARPHLRLDHGEQLLAAGFTALLLFHAVRRLASWRPLLDRPGVGVLPRRPSVLFFLLPLVVYLAFIPWSTSRRPPDGDEPWYLLISHSLVHDLDADLTNNYRDGDWQSFLERPLTPQPGDPEGPQGQLYSRHNALLPALLAPAYLIAGRAGALAMMAALTAALAWMTLRLAFRYFPHRPREALFAYGLVALAPPLLLYSYQVWVEVPAALLALVALDASLGLRGHSAGKRASDAPAGDELSRRRLWLVIALCLVLLPLLKIRFMLLSAPLLAIAWWHAGRPLKPALLLGGTLGTLGSGILLFNQLRYGNPLKIHSWQEVEVQRYQLSDYLEGVSGLFFDSAFGLFPAAPLWLLLLPALLLLAVRRHRLLGDLTLLVLPYLMIVAPRSEWYGGWSPPFRYALVALPLLGVALVPLLAGTGVGQGPERPADRRRGGWSAPGALLLIAVTAAATLALTLLWVAMPGWTYDFADGRTYLLDHLGQRIGADVARLFPSSVRPRPATWLWPPLTVLAVLALWWLPRRRNDGSVGEGRGGEGRRMSGGIGALTAAGVALLFAAMAIVPPVARSLPTRVVELEDPYVIKDGGHLHPDRWIIERTRHHGGWVLREGEALTAPLVAPVPRGETVEVAIALELFFVRHNPSPASLEVRAGDRLLTAVELTEERSWHRLELPPIAWPSGAPLVLALPPPEHRRRVSGVVLDKAELAWR